jgi:RNA recognition motif-containing protein
MNLYVSNLGERITDESLRAVFATHGEVRSSKVIKDHFTGYSRGFAFIEMPNDTEAENAITKINGSVVDGRNISVTEARPRPTQKEAFISKLKG